MGTTLVSKKPSSGAQLFGLLLFGASVAGAEEAALRPLSTEEKAAIEARILSNEGVRSKTASEKLRVLAITAEEPAKPEGAALPAARGPRLAEAIVVGYGSGRGFRIRVDLDTSTIVATEPLRGRPQSSGAEREEGERLVRSDPRSAELLQGGARLQGGFVVDGPAGAGEGRFLEFHLANAEGLVMLREVIVDLSRSKVARASDEAGSTPKD